MKRMAGMLQALGLGVCPRVSYCDSYDWAASSSSLVDPLLAQQELRPLEFAIASLNNARDDEHAVKLLRDMVDNEGMDYCPVNPEKSVAEWSVIDGVLTGGLCNIKGIGLKKAAEFIRMREGKRSATPSFWKMKGRGLAISTRSAALRPSFQRRRRAEGWGCRYAESSWPSMAAPSVWKTAMK